MGRSERFHPSRAQPANNSENLTGMMANTYSAFLQRVRRHRASDLLLALASTSIRLFEQEAWIADRVRSPWAIAAAAKASIVAGNEHRRPGVTDRDVMEICAAYNALDTPLTHEPGDTTETVGAFLVRTSYEQFPYQQSRFEEISRLGALFDGIDALDTEILDHALIEQVLGCPLGDFVVAGFVLATSAQSNTGFFDPEWAALREGPHAINRQFPIDTVRRVFHKHFLATFEEIRAAAKKTEQPDQRLRHHEFNPLINRPFVTLPGGRHIAPQPHFVFQRLSPAALYYAAVDALDGERANAFTRDIGLVCQEYVGRQLRLVPKATVLPEIVYDGDQRSVDWFVIFDDLVVLVEVKFDPNEPPRTYGRQQAQGRHRALHRQGLWAGRADTPASGSGTSCLCVDSRRPLPDRDHRHPRAVLGR